MLVISRKKGEEINIDQGMVIIRVIKLSQSTVWLEFDAPNEISIKPVEKEREEDE